MIVEQGLDMKDRASQISISKVLVPDDSRSNYRFNTRSVVDLYNRSIVMGRCHISNVGDIVNIQTMSTLEDSLVQRLFSTSTAEKIINARQAGNGNGSYKLVTNDDIYSICFDKSVQIMFHRECIESWSLKRLNRLQVSMACCNLVKASMLEAYEEVKEKAKNSLKSAIESLDKLSFQQLIEKSFEDRQESLVIEEYLSFASIHRENRIKDFVGSFATNLPYLTMKEKGSFIISSLITASMPCREMYREFAQKNIAMLVDTSSSLKPMQTLVSLSLTFCTFFSNEFIKNYSELSCSKFACLLMNRIISISGCQESDVEKIIDRMRPDLASFNRREKKELLRICSSILNRCDVDKVSVIITFVKTNIWWLIDDKIGNYSVQELLEVKYAKYWKSIFDHISQYPLIAFEGRFFPRSILKKLVRYDVLSRIETDLLVREKEIQFKPKFKDYLYQSVLSLMKDHQSFQKVLRSQNSAKLFILILMHLESIETAEQVRKFAYNYFQSKRPSFKAKAFSKSNIGVNFNSNILNNGETDFVSELDTIIYTMTSSEDRAKV